MNKSIPFFILLILFSLGGYSQSYLGIFGGINNSKLSGDAPLNAQYKSLIGANIGAHFDIKLSKVTALSIQASFSQEGTKIFYTVNDHVEPVDSLNLRLNYFSLPLLFRITSNNEKFYAIAGIETAYLMSKNMKSQNTTEEIKASISDFNFAMHFGAGIRIPIGYPRLFIEVRYTQGLVNLTDDPLKNNIIPRAKTSGFNAVAGIEIPLSKPKK